MKKKETRGGTRQGSGAKPKYNEETKTVAFRCPISKIEEVKALINHTLSKWSVKAQSEQLKAFNCVNFEDEHGICKEQCDYCKRVKGF